MCCDQTTATTRYQIQPALVRQYEHQFLGLYCCKTGNISCSGNCTKSQTAAYRLAQ